MGARVGGRSPQRITDPVVSVAPGGVLSLMFYNAHGLLMHNRSPGILITCRRECRKRKNGRFARLSTRPGAGLSVAGRSWLQIMGKTGVRVFHDYLREKHRSATAMKHYLN